MEVTYVGKDDWSRELYKSTKTDRIFVNVDGTLHTITDEGEPYFPLIFLDDPALIVHKEASLCFNVVPVTRRLKNWHLKCIALTVVVVIG